MVQTAFTWHWSAFLVFYGHALISFSSFSFIPYAKSDHILRHAQHEHFQSRRHLLVAPAFIDFHKPWCTCVASVFMHSSLSQWYIMHVCVYVAFTTDGMERPWLDVQMSLALQHTCIRTDETLGTSWHLCSFRLLLVSSVHVQYAQVHIHIPRAVHKLILPPQKSISCTGTSGVHPGPLMASFGEPLSHHLREQMHRRHASPSVPSSTWYLEGSDVFTASLCAGALVAVSSRSSMPWRQWSKAGILLGSCYI